MSDDCHSDPILEREKFEWLKSITEKSIDFDYVRATIIILLLIIIFYYVMIRYGDTIRSIEPGGRGKEGRGKGGDQGGGNDNGGNSGGDKHSKKKTDAMVEPSGNSTEHFYPFESALVHDMPRSDPSGDFPPYNWKTCGSGCPAYDVDEAMPEISENPYGRSSEKMLFYQTNGWAMV